MYSDANFEMCAHGKDSMFNKWKSVLKSMINKIFWVKVLKIIGGGEAGKFKHVCGTDVSKISVKRKN